MPVIQDHQLFLLEGNTIKQGIAKSFYGQNAHVVLQEAQDYGDVITLPEFLQALYLSSFEDSLTRIPFTVQTEEIIGRSKAGNEVAIVVHGLGLLTSQRIHQRIRIEELTEGKVPDHGLTRTASGRGQFALPLQDDEVYALLDGYVVPVFSYSEFIGISRLPRDYAVVRDLDLQKEIPSGNYSLNLLQEIPRVIALAGGVDNLKPCLDLLALHYGQEEIRYSHHLHDIDPRQPQGRFLEVHGTGDLFYGEMEMDGPARFLAVKRGDLEEKIDKAVTVEM